MQKEVEEKNADQQLPADEQEQEREYQETLHTPLDPVGGEY